MELLIQDKPQFKKKLLHVETLSNATNLSLVAQFILAQQYSEDNF